MFNLSTEASDHVNHHFEPLELRTSDRIAIPYNQVELDTISPGLISYLVLVVHVETCLPSSSSLSGILTYSAYLISALLTAELTAVLTAAHSVEPTVILTAIHTVLLSAVLTSVLTVAFTAVLTLLILYLVLENSRGTSFLNLIY